MEIEVVIPRYSIAVSATSRRSSIARPLVDLAF
jgi:hypothetical protein